MEKAQKCVWWGILKIFWAQQDLKITKTISKGDRAVQMQRVRFSVEQLSAEGGRQGLPRRSLHMQDFGCEAQRVSAWCNFVMYSCHKAACK